MGDFFQDLLDFWPKLSKGADPLSQPKLEDDEFFVDQHGLKWKVGDLNKVNLQIIVRRVIRLARQGHVWYMNDNGVLRAKKQK